jgi:hypothetical protein
LKGGIALSRELSSDPHVNISAYVPFSLRQATAAIARAEGVTLSEEVRIALGLLVKSHATERQDDKVAVA